jgi:glycosyltransferase involved in cell wall biosynthesis
VRRVLLLTSHPLEGRDGADKQLATSVARNLPDTSFTWFSRAPAVSQPALATGRRLRVLSRQGVPGPSERLQIAVRATYLEPRVDLVHAVLTVGPGFARYGALRAKLPSRLRRPVLHTVPGIAAPEMLAGAGPLGRTVALSEATASRLRDAGFGDVVVVPPGVEMSRWPAAPRPSEDVATVLFAGHHDPGGGAEDVVLAVAAAASRGHPLRLILAMRPRVGQDERAEAQRLSSLAASHGVTDVEVLGRVDDLPALVGSADVLVFPPRQLHGKADVPLTVLEALATARPAIVSDLPEFAALGDAVVRVPAGDTDALGDALDELLRSPRWWDELATGGRRLVEERFSDVSMAATYGRLYDELLTG